MLKIKTGCSMMVLLFEQLGLSAEYVEKRIQTIFLDGKPVDNLNTTYIHEGSTIALSSAMPGLLGATLRRGGRYSHMRSQISYVEQSKSPKIKDGEITIKFFNLTADELGPIFLERGIWVGTRDLKDLFKIQSDDFWKGCTTMIVNGEEIGVDQFPYLEWNEKQIFLQIKAI